MSSNWSAKFPVYQIDFTALASGKLVATSKRRIRWRFGFPNKKALEDGQTGTECRGEEHDVTIVWSVTSGKRQVTMDGREVHYSISRSGLLDYSWATRGNHVMKVIAHAAPPLSATPGFRQYDLLIDGQSFFTMPKVYELGIKGPISAHARVPGLIGNGQSTSSDYAAAGSRGNVDGGRMYDLRSGQYIKAPGSVDEEEADLQAAIRASLEESRKHLARQGISNEGDNYTTYSSPQATNEDTDLLDMGGGGGGGGPPGPNPPRLQYHNAPPNDAQSVMSQYSAPPSYNPTAAPHYQTNGAAPYQSPPPMHSPDPTGGGQLVPARAPPGYYHGATPYYPHQNGGGSSYPVPPVPAPTQDYGGPPQQRYASAPAPNPQNGYSAQPAPEFLNAPSQPADVFGLQSPIDDDPFAPKPLPPPTQNDIHSAILGAYSSPRADGAPTTPAGSQPSPQGFQSPDGQQPSPQQQNGHFNGYANGGTLTMGPHVETEEEEEISNPVDAALKKLVNIDRIDEPAESLQKLTIMKQEEAKKAPKGKSRGLPPVAIGYVGTHATLSQISQVKPEKPKPKVEDIMKPPPPTLFQAGVVHAGALVVHGQGAPPLQQPRGFGVGAHLPNGGFQQQQPTNSFQRPYQHPPQTN